ncbi:hypothetical protein D6817_03655 [Candidatus Pacearchaeota archaeon]|nr:MAG: hypothetical protein D6817_03655 [Candidatus Pacearchaeota archaeon]
MKKFVANFQIGKHGLTDGVLNSLNLALKNHKQVRVHFLRSCTRDKTEINAMVNEIKSKLTKKCSFRLIGFRLIITKLKDREI